MANKTIEERRAGYSPEPDGVLYDVITHRPGKKPTVEQKTVFQVCVLVKAEWERIHYPDVCSDERIRTMMSRLHKDYGLVISNLEILRP